MSFVLHPNVFNSYQGGASEGLQDADTEALSEVGGVEGLTEALGDSEALGLKLGLGDTDAD